MSRIHIRFIERYRDDQRIVFDVETIDNYFIEELVQASGYMPVPEMLVLGQITVDRQRKDYCWHQDDGIRVQLVNPEVFKDDRIGLDAPEVISCAGGSHALRIHKRATAECIN